MISILLLPSAIHMQHLKNVKPLLKFLLLYHGQVINYPLIGVLPTKNEDPAIRLSQLSSLPIETE